MNWFRPARVSAAVAEAGHSTLPATPRHVAIIMDGNGRWARARKLPRVAGHRAGVEAVRRVVKAAPDFGIDTLTLYAFSSENWRRPASEVSDLMGLLRHYIRSELEQLKANGVRLHLIGQWRELNTDIVAELDDALHATACNTRLNLVIALNYGAQDELVRVAQRLALDACEGRMQPGAIGAADIEARLDTAGLPPVDFIIRTSGELRLSNFLLWQAAYAELWFTDTLWPDFDEATIQEGLAAFQERERRYGGL